MLLNLLYDDMYCIYLIYRDLALANTNKHALLHPNYTVYQYRNYSLTYRRHNNSYHGHVKYNAGTRGAVM